MGCIIWQLLIKFVKNIVGITKVVFLYQNLK